MMSQNMQFVTFLSIFGVCFSSVLDVPPVGTTEGIKHGLSRTSLTFELPDKDLMCFYQSYLGSSRWIFTFKVLKGGKNDVGASLESPNGKILYKENKIKEDKFVFETSVGVYKICFSNEFSTVTHKVVYFELRPEDADSLADGVGQKPSADTQLEASLESVHQHCVEVGNFQTSYRLDEAKGRHCAEDLNQRVLLWSLGQALVILMAGFGQVYILKTFFTDKKTSVRAAVQT